MALSKKIVLFENSGKDFLSARLSLANYLIEKGHKVYAFVPLDEDLSYLQDLGIFVRTYAFERKNKGIIQLLKISFHLFRLVKV